MHDLFLQEMEQYLTTRGGLLPFDSLLVPHLSQQRILQLAAGHTGQRFAAVDSVSAGTNRTESADKKIEEVEKKDHGRMREGTAGKVLRTLRLGFLSYDFNDHPTSHLVEGLFFSVRKGQRRATAAGGVWGLGGRPPLEVDPLEGLNTSVFDSVELLVYSYGKDDGSTYVRMRGI